MNSVKSISSRVIVIGLPRVGKTSLKRLFIDNQYIKEYFPTIAMQTSQRTIPGTNLNLNIEFWDIAGQKEYRENAFDFVCLSDIILIVYDLSQPQSYIEASTWANVISSNCEKAYVVLLGNKIDLVPRKYKNAVLRKYSELHGAKKHFLVSVKRNAGFEIGVNQRKLLVNIIEDLTVEGLRYQIRLSKESKSCNPNFCLFSPNNRTINQDLTDEFKIEKNKVSNYAK